MKIILLAVAVSFAIAAILGPFAIRYLQKMKFGQKILEIGPKWHMNKQYTPTMGGFIFIIAITVTMLSVPALFYGFDISFFHVLLLALAFGAIGFIDDFAKIKKKQNMGLTAMQKLVLQIFIAAAFIAALRLNGFLTPNLYIPFANITLPMPWVLFVPFAAFVIVGTVNAVNLTDGIDGLAAGVTLPVSVFFVITGVISQNLPVSVFAASLLGALAAFLIYNFNPAKVFMGDTGSLFLGGAVAGMAFACDMPLILILIGFIYIVETLSDIIQVTYFKLSHGKRIFKMAPIHHHFEMCGWGEKKIVFVFTAITIFMCVLAYLGIAPRYIF